MEVLSVYPQVRWVDLKDTFAIVKKISFINNCRHKLTLYHTIPTLKDPEGEAFYKHGGKRRKCWLPAFSPFPTMFSTLSRRKMLILATFDVLSANTLNLVQLQNFVVWLSLKGIVDITVYSKLSCFFFKCRDFVMAIVVCY